MAGFSPKLTTPYAVRPFFAVVPDDSGSPADSTCGRALTFAAELSIALRWPAREPELTVNTSWPLNPPACGSCSCSSAAPAWDGELGSEKLSV